MGDSKYFTGCGIYRSLPIRKAKKKITANNSRLNSNETNIKEAEENSQFSDESTKTKKKPAPQKTTANTVKKKPTPSNKNCKSKDFSKCSINNIEEEKERITMEDKIFEEIDDMPLSSLQPFATENGTKKRKCKKTDNSFDLKKNNQPKAGCNCGSGSLNPSKLTCCGQRCLCYSKNRPCINCKCKGCRNTIKFEEIKNAASTLPQYEPPPIIDDDPTSFVFNDLESGIETPPESSPLAAKPMENILTTLQKDAQSALEVPLHASPLLVQPLQNPILVVQPIQNPLILMQPIKNPYLVLKPIENQYSEANQPSLLPQAAPLSSLESISITDQSILAATPYICPSLFTKLMKATVLTTAPDVSTIEPTDPYTNEIISDEQYSNWSKDVPIADQPVLKEQPAIEVANSNPPFGVSANPVDIDHNSTDSVIEVTSDANPLQEQAVSSTERMPISVDLDDSNEADSSSINCPKMSPKEQDVIELSDRESTSSDVVSVYNEDSYQPVPSPIFTEEDMRQLQSMLEEENFVPLPIPYRPPPPPSCLISKERRRKRARKNNKLLNFRYIVSDSDSENANECSATALAEREAVIEDLQQIISKVSKE